MSTTLTYRDAPLSRTKGTQYEKKVRDYLRNHTDHLVIHRLRTNQPLAEIGEDDGPSLLNNLLERNNAPSLAWFVRSLVGMDHTTAQQAFSEFLNERSLTSDQIRFVELIIDQLTARGIITQGLLTPAT